VHDKFEVWEVPKVRLVGLREHARPVLGEIDEVRVIVPVNPFVGAIMMVEAAVAPAYAVRPVGLAVTVKSGATLFHSEAPALTREVVPPTIIVSAGRAEF
jgi:hypothetical protein